MQTTIKIKASDLNNQILEGIKKMFGNQQINISITTEYDYDTIQDIKNRINKVAEDSEHYTFSGKEFQELTRRLLEDETPMSKAFDTKE